ncbi:organic hydroperoxide resistance protein [Bradyrhizobium sp. USDA 4454]
MTIEAKYRTTATAAGGRDGRAYTEDQTFDLELSTPKELGGSGGPSTNPEQLFAAGYSACFLSALNLVGRKRKIGIAADSSISATVGIGPNGQGGFGLVVQLSANLPGVERTTAEQLVAEADQICPYSNAIRGNVDVHIVIA